LRCGSPPPRPAGPATIIVVLIAMLGSVTVLPAMLSVLGDRVDFGRVPGLARLRRPPTPAEAAPSPDGPGSLRTTPDP